MTLRTRLTTVDLPTLLNHLNRASIGFDDMFDSLHRFAVNDSVKYPPHDIIRHSDTSYSVEVAVAGFKEDEIDVTIDNSVLTIRGAQAEKSGVDYLYQGISTRSFTKTINLTPHVVVNGAKLSNGMLIVELEVVIPEELKPRKIPISVDKKIAIG